MTDHATIANIARKHSKDHAQILIRWSLQKGQVFYRLVLQLIIEASSRFVPLPKSSNPDRIASNFQVFDFKLDEDDMAELDSLDRGDKGAVTWNPINSP
jgi:diketogulonate reductase-like aldo/keto reductase